MVSYPRRNDYEDVDACAGFGGSCADSWRDDRVDDPRPAVFLYAVPHRKVS